MVLQLSGLADRLNMPALHLRSCCNMHKMPSDCLRTNPKCRPGVPTCIPHGWLHCSGSIDGRQKAREFWIER